MTEHKINKAMSNIQQYMVENPISKSRKNKFQNYDYRGIEDVVQAFSKPLADNHVILLPQNIDVDTTYLDDAKNSTVTRISGILRFLCTEDGSYLDRSYEGHSKSAQQKCLEAAKSFAFRDALLETFCVPFNQVEPETEADEDDSDGSNNSTEQTLKEFEEELNLAQTKEDRKNIFKNYDREAELVGDEEARVQLNLIYSKLVSS